MHHLVSSSLLFTILLASSSASPLAKRDPTAYSKIHRQVIPGSGPRSFSKVRDRACLRYNLDCQSQAREELATNTASTASPNEKLATGGGPGSGEVTATPVNHDSEYICPIKVGGQTLNVNIDTGSSDLYIPLSSRPIRFVSLTRPSNRWVFNTALGAAEQSGRTVYDPSKSPTYKNVAGSSFAVNYGDSSQTYGSVGVDTVEVAGITVVGQAIELPSAVSSSFTNDINAEGILGLAFQSSNTIKPVSQPTFFENAQSSLQHAVFTANLKANTPGNYQFGVIDHTAYAGDTINYTPVNSSGGVWQFATKPGSSPAVADTGSSLLLLDDDIVNAYWAQVSVKSTDGHGSITFPCSTTLPDFHIQLGESYTATIAGSLINYATAAGQAGCEYIHLMHHGRTFYSDSCTKTDCLLETDCFGGLQSNTGQNINIFGDIMFQSQFVVFDAQNMQIGFAPHAA